MKGGLGFYSGQLSQFAIVKDEDPHKPIFLIDVWFKKDRGSTYESLEADGLMVDLADAATLLVKSVSDVSLSTEMLSPSHDDIAYLAHKLWAERGAQDGYAEQDWFHAEQELQAAKTGDSTV